MTNSLSSLSSPVDILLIIKQSILVAGLHYIESNFASVTDKNQASPFGFDIIFPGMLEYAKDLDIKLPLNQTHLSVMLHERELELRRYADYYHYTTYTYQNS